MESLIAELKRLGIVIWVEDGKLRYKSPEGVLTPQVRQRIVDAKQSLIEMLGSTDRAASAAQLPPITPRTSGEEIRLSYAQERLWFLHQLLPDRPTYNMGYAYRLRGALDVDALRQAMRCVIERHEVLRTGIVAVDGVARACVFDDVVLELPVIDLSGHAAVEREAYALELATHEVRRPFDLGSAPLLRARLLQLDRAEYWLVLCLHHIVSDDWSFDILWRELDVYYEAGRKCVVPQVAELGIRYADFAAWQREQLDTGRLQEQVAYWKHQLRAPLAGLGLSTDHPRPSEKQYRGDVRNFAVPDRISAGLRQVAQSCNATLFMVLAAAFKVLLYRHTGQQDIVIGTAIAGRGQHEVEPLIGFFVNNLVLRTSLSGDPRFTELVARVRAVALAGYANQDVPFERVIDVLRPERDTARTPFFDVLLVLHRPPTQRKLGELQIEPLSVTTATAKFDLTLEIAEASDGGLGGYFEFDTDLYDSVTIDRLALHLLALLEGIASSPEARLSELPLLSPAENRQLAQWNDTAVEVPRDALMHDLFEQQSECSPERAALRAGSVTVSYAELNARAGRIAGALRQRGVGRGQRIGLCLERGTEMVAALFGILKAGAAYVPLDPGFPAERLRYVAEDAQLTLLVSTSALAEPFAMPRERLLLLDADAVSISGTPDYRLRSDTSTARPRDPAYIIYTSGSTGRPKGVIVPHRAVVNFLGSMGREPGLGPDDVLVAVTTLSFDIAVLELQLPLTCGATVVIAGRDEAQDGLRLARLIDEHGATVMQATPITWRLLLEAGWRGRAGFKALVGGEALPRDLAEQLLACGVALWNMYGPTEATVWSTCGRITDTVQGITIGRPIANTAIHILDEAGNVCPIGVPGEICIGGEGVALGYWNRPDLTAERFVRDRFDATPGATMYRTGDRGRWRSDGQLEHLGRLDFQVKVRGYRIEPGEIEVVLARHAQVVQSVVVAREDQPGDVRLVAYVVSRGAMPAAAELRSHLRLELPEYMVPQHFVRLEAVPLTANGKVDRKALPAPDQTGPALAESVHAVQARPLDEAERVVAQVWSELLGVDDIEAEDNFFDLGGHSLLALQAIARIEKRMGVRLRPQQFTLQTLEQMARGLPADGASQRPAGLLGRLFGRRDRG